MTVSFFKVHVARFYSLYLLLGVLYLFLSFLSLRSLFLLVGILTLLSVRVPKGNLCHRSLMKKVGQSTEAQRLARGAWGCTESFLQQARMRISEFQSCAASLWRCSFHTVVKVLPVRSPKFQQFPFIIHFQGLCVMGDGNIQYANSISRFFDTYCQLLWR